jgi:Zn-dependent protease/CBS domain-containing protein
MRWTFRLARIAGIDINIHLTFLLLLPVGAMLWGGRYGTAGALFGVLMIILLFACVTLHELGHALAARTLGIPVKEIQLLPIGGVAVMGRPITQPLDELAVALAGPLMNVLIAIGLAMAAAGAGMFNGLGAEQIAAGIGAPSVQGAVLWLIQANVLLVLFNMIPAFPMDGGRVLRAGLALAAGMPRATALAAAVGQGIAVLMGLWGLFSGNLLLVAGAVFIFTGARQEALAARVIGVLSGLRVADAFTRHSVALEIGQRLGHAGDLMAATGLRALPVMQGERLLGVVTLDQVEAARATGRADAWVTAAMRRDLPRVAHDEPLDEAQLLLAEQRAPALAVYEGDTFLGLLTVDDVRAAFARGAAHEPQRQQPSGAVGD